MSRKGTGLQVAAADGETPAPRPDWLPDGCEMLADGEYDAIVMGTGLKEAIMSGLLSTLGMKILHVDRNNYYGGDCASLNLTNLYKKFRPGQPPAPELGHPTRDYNVDLIPKFLMANGNLVKMLLMTKVGWGWSWVGIGFGGFGVPATPEEALRTSLMGMFEKRRFRNFLMYLAAYEEDNPATYNGRDLKTMTMLKLYEDFGLDENTQSFTGHAMALQRDDSYLNKPAVETVKSIQLYVRSLERYGKSPYIYPMYGLGGLPEGFSRLCAIHGGTFMLQCPVEEVRKRVAKATMLIGDPSYFPSRMVKPTGMVARSICIMDHPFNGTNNAESTQIIIPGRQVGRHNDIYVCMVSFSHCVASPGKYVAIASTTVETSDPLAELAPAFELLGPVMERFDEVSTTLAPVEDGMADRCFISESYDATSHFETTATDVQSLYERVTGQKMDLTIDPEVEQEEG
eukprot:jgi/Undpi1/13873/HiC_scaffold_9.g03524.m1